MPAIHLTTNDFEEKALKSDKPVLVDFFAVWCGPCKMAEPIIEELADKYKEQAVVAKLNVDEEPQIAQRYGVMSIPTVIMFKDGKEVDRQVGFIGREGYEQMIKNQLD